ncbi:MAG: DUF4345 family protein [Nannocystis sp.]|nr:DUF4345 family protein [Nannocystis sp.]
MFERPPAVTRALLTLNALAFIGLGAGFLAWPSEMAATVEIEATSALARGDIRAVYGGLELGFGVGLLLARDRVTVGFACQILALVFAGLVAARAGSMLAEGVPPAPGPLLLGIELAGLLSALLALRQLRVAR